MPPTTARRAPARGGHARTRSAPAPRHHRRISGPIARPVPAVALPLAWELLAKDGRFGAISFHSLEDRRVKRFLAARAKGCICPPDLPVCGCGRVPEAEILTRRAVAPTPGEVAANPRARSARMRAARKLEVPDA